MRNIFKKSFLFILVGLTTSIVSAETMYVISGQCNVPLSAGMNNARNNQFFIWDGSNATLTTAVTCNITSTAGFYYNSTSLAYADITNASNYSSSSSSARTMRGFKITGSETMTIGLGSIAISKIIVGGRCASNDPCTLNVAGETVSTNNKNSFVKVVEGTFTNQIQIANSSGKEYNVIVFLIEGVAGPVAVTGVTLNKTTTSIEAGQSEQLTATVLPANADNKSVTWSSNNTAVATVDNNGNVSALAAGTATITVTTADGNKTATCTVTVTAPAAPIDVQSISMKSSTTIAIGASETLTVTYTPADANTNKALTWNSNNTSVATVDANGKVTGISAGTATITATTANNKSATCMVTVQAVSVTSVTLNKTSLSLQIGGSETLTATIAPTDATNKNISWISSNPAVATVDSNGKVVAKTAGNTTITVTTTDGNKTATCNVTVTAGPPVPDTNLTTHVPEIYEAKEIAGGYGGKLSVFGGREYEVYYGSYKEKNDTLTITVFPTQKSSGITTSLNKTSFKATDGWFEGTAVGGKSNYTFTDLDEFKAGAGALHKLKNGNEYVFHIQGYDQFSFMGKDNNADASKGRYLQVYIDNVLQTSNLSTSYSIRRFNITTGEHVIKIKAIHDGDSQSEICGFSLRVSQEPRTKYLKGNDSTQVVMQTAAIKPVTYVTKYNNIPGAVTELEWIGTAANGIGLTKIDGELTDTLILGGTANCATGTYHYAVVAKYNGIETSRATGTFTVKSDIKATSEIEVDVYNNETMDQITFKYYALSDNDVIVTWPNGQPAGISGSGNNGKYIIGGTPNLTGTFPQTFPYTITVNGADTIISGKITVKELNYTDKSVLYLYKNSSAYQHDDIYKYLKNKGWDLIERKALEDGLRPAEQYRNYKFIIISEDADADNAEVLAVMKSGANLPVLNLKGFTYAHQRNEDTPDGWGEPDNGAIDTIEMKGRNIKIEQPSHPIFKKMNGVSNGKEIAILDSYGQHGVMPIRVTRPGTLCLATGYTRSTSDYYEAGELQTAIHEVPAGMNGGIKYICLSLSRTAVLSADGKKLIDGIVDYLTSDTQSDIDVPNCQIMTFTVAGKEGVVNHAAHSIVINMSVDEFQAADSLKNAEPVITLADPNTHVVPDSKELRYAAMGLPKKYTVTDYINLWVYEVSIRLYTPQGLEETYESGMWVNIFDIYGRKVATTNEDIYTMDLPHGMYIVVTETGSTLKIMR